MTTEFRPTAAQIPAQTLPYPASQEDMTPQPDSDMSNYKPAAKLQGKVALITGGDSGIGRAVAIAYAMEGADIAIVYNENDRDANVTQALVEEKGQHCLTIKADVRDSAQCQQAVAQTVKKFGHLEILVNNAGYQAVKFEIEEISDEQFRRTMETNMFGYFYMLKAALPHLKAGDTVINTSSILGLIGKEFLVDYSASKGAINAFTKAAAQNLAKRKIRINAVAPGPVWTPGIPGTMTQEQVDNFDKDNAMKRAAQPEELAPTYVYFASEDSSFVTGAILEVTGGQVSST
jgi:NAD(P)-dependent dehydrogenase (short-subunit alcohol dehydrogenase family)